MGRENARQMRHCISAPMWSALNAAYLSLQQVNILEIWNASPESFYAATSAEIDTFMGIAAATMYRDEGWHFMQLGRFIERAQLAVALFVAQIDLFPLDARGEPEGSESDWISLLRLYHAVEAYNRAYSVQVSPAQVLDLLATDPLLPQSICRSLDSAATELAAIAPAPNVGADAAARRMAGRLAAIARYEWPDATDHARLLASLQRNTLELHSLVANAFFDYPVPIAPAS